MKTSWRRFWGKLNYEKFLKHCEEFRVLQVRRALYRGKAGVKMNEAWHDPSRIFLSHSLERHRQSTDN